MGQLAMAATMDAIAARLKALGIRRVYGWPILSVTPPAALVGYPEEITYDNTKGRGSDRLTFPVFVVVGQVADKAARDTLSGYIDPESSLSVKTALEAVDEGDDGSLDGTVSKARVSAARPQYVVIGEVQYLAASFDVDIVT